MKTGIRFSFEFSLGGLFIAACVIALAISFASFRRPPKRGKPVQPQPSDQPPAGDAAPAPEQPQPDFREMFRRRGGIFSRPVPTDGQPAPTAEAIIERSVRHDPEYIRHRDLAFAKWQRERLPDHEARIRGSFARHFAENLALLRGESTQETDHV